MQNRVFLSVSFVLVLLLQASCGLLNNIEVPALLGTPTPQPSPTPLGNILQFQTGENQYEVVLAPNETVAGTQLRFLGKEGNVYTVSQDGVTGGIPSGNSFNWRGVIGPGATGDYRLKLLQTFSDNELRANGTVVVTIFEPTAVERPLPQTDVTPLQFVNMPVNYLIPVGSPVPGTTLVYDGEQVGAHLFSGTSSLNRFFLDDEILWNGFLRDNIYIQNSLKLQAVNETGLQMTGTVTLYIFPSAVPPAQ